MLGNREIAIYGGDTYDDLAALCEKTAKSVNLSVIIEQNNHEGKLIDIIQGAIKNTAGLIINAGAFTHTSLALHDALRTYPHPIIEVHISNIFARENIRHNSYIAPLAKGTVCGFGINGYKYAIMYLSELLTHHD